MNIAQKLYEGIDLGTELTGLISYMRTDSVRLSDEFVSKTQKFIEENYGKQYVGYLKTSKKTEKVWKVRKKISNFVRSNDADTKRTGVNFQNEPS